MPNTLGRTETADQLNGAAMILQWILISAIPAIGALILFLILQQWGKKHDPMGGRPGHIWKPDNTKRGPGED